MSVCKLCMKSFLKLSPKHLYKHGFKNREEYEEATKDIEVPQKLMEYDKKRMKEHWDKKMKVQEENKRKRVALPEEPKKEVVSRPKTPSELMTERILKERGLL